MTTAAVRPWPTVPHRDGEAVAIELAEVVPVPPACGTPACCVIPTGDPSEEGSVVDPSLRTLAIGADIGIAAHGT